MNQPSPAALQSTTRAAALARVGSLSVRWITRWGVARPLMRDLLPGLAAGKANRIPCHAGTQEERWAALSTADLEAVAASLEYSLQGDETRGDAGRTLVGWLTLAELIPTAAELRPLEEADCPGWARAAANRIARDLAEGKKRDAQRARHLARQAACSPTTVRRHP